jgi:hypothetical protein
MRPGWNRAGSKLSNNQEERNGAMDLFGPPGATGRKFTVRQSDVHSPHENGYLTVFQMAGKSE